MKFSSELSVTNFIENSLELCGKSNLADLMSISAKVSRDNKRISYVKPHLPAIALRASALSDSKWKFRDVSAIVNGLQFMSDDDPGAADLLKIMTQAIHQISNSRERKIKAIDITMLLNGIEKFNPDSDELLGLLSAMVPVVSNCKEIFTNQRISATIYALLNMTADYAEIREMISVLCEKLTGSIGEFLPQDYYNMGFGLRRMSSDHDEVRFMYSVIAKSLKNSEAEFKVSNLCTMIHNLSTANSDHAEVREYLSAIHTQIKACTATDMDSKSISNALLGLQRMNTDRREVRNILSMFAGKIKKNNDDWSLLSLSNSMIGLQRTSDCPELVSILNAILPKIRNLKVEMTAQCIADCVFGTQNLTGATVPKRDLLYALNIELKKSTDIFTPKAGSDFLYGIQRMTTDIEEVNTILSTMISKFQQIPRDIRFTAKELSYALYGLQGLWNGESDSDFSTVLDEICVRADVISFFESSESATKASTDDLVDLQNNLYFFIHALNSVFAADEKKYEGVHLISKIVITELETRKEQNDEFFSKEKSVSNNQQTLFEILSEIYEDKEAEIAQNTYYLNTFEFGLMITLPDSNRDDNNDNDDDSESYNMVINIEINTVGSEKSKKILYRERRDAFLKGENVLVIRLHDAILDGMSRESIKELLLKKLEVIENF
jgi:uncharacterized protein (UPF0147 family)